MKCLGRVAAALALVMLVDLAASAHAGETLKHSGSIVALADEAHSFVLAEVGPWRVRDGVTVVTYRTITLTPATEFVIVDRATDAGSGYRGDFVEKPVDPSTVDLDEYMTVECRRDGTRLLALKITVVRPPRS